MLGGESAQKNALLWDQINAVNYTPYSDIESVIPQLEIRHNLRVSEDAQFATLLQSLDEFDQNRNKTLISLNEEKRRIEREEAEKKKKERKEKNEDAEDLLLLESARILSDYILLQTAY